jgi:hypothetical protein
MTTSNAEEYTLCSCEVYGERTMHKKQKVSESTSSIALNWQAEFAGKGRE